MIVISKDAREIFNETDNAATEVATESSEATTVVVTESSEASTITGLKLKYELRFLIVVWLVEIGVN